MKFYGHEVTGKDLLIVALASVACLAAAYAFVFGMFSL